MGVLGEPLSSVEMIYEVTFVKHIEKPHLSDSWLKIKVNIHFITGNCYFQTGLCYGADDSDSIVIVPDKIHGVIIFLALEAQLVKNPPAVQETRLNSWVRKILWRRERLPALVFLGFPGGSESKGSVCNAKDPGSVPGMIRSPGEGMAAPSSRITWRIPWTEKPGRIPWTGSQGVWHDWATVTDSLIYS